MRNSSKASAPRSSSEGQYVETNHSHAGVTHRIEWVLFSVFSIMLSVTSMAYVLENKLHPLLLKTGILTVEAKTNPPLPCYLGGKARLPQKVNKKPPASVAKKTSPKKVKAEEKPDVAKQHPDSHLIPWIIAAEMQKP